MAGRKVYLAHEYLTFRNHTWAETFSDGCDLTLDTGACRRRRADQHALRHRAPDCRSVTSWLRNEGARLKSRTSLATGSLSVSVA